MTLLISSRFKHDGSGWDGWLHFSHVQNAIIIININARIIVTLSQKKLQRHFTKSESDSHILHKYGASYHRCRSSKDALNNDFSSYLSKCQVRCSDHIVAQQANRYIVAFHITISYDMQRPWYNGRAVGLRAACMVCNTLTDHCTRWPVTSALQRSTTACETHWMRQVSRRRWARLMFDVQGHWQCAAETGTIYDDVFTGSTRRRHGLTWAGAWWPGLVSRYTDSFSQL